jgi:hypothetical protein
MEGHDPYAAYLRGDVDLFVMSQHPNYLPLLYILLVPLALVPLHVAGVIWTIINISLGYGAAVLLSGERSPGWGSAALFGLLMLSEPFSVTLGNGQFSIVVLFCAAVLVRTPRLGASIGALAVLVTKYSFAPLALVPASSRRWSVLLGTVVIQAAACALVSIVTGSSLTSVIVEPLYVAREMARGLGDVMTLTRVLGGSMALGYTAAGLTLVALTLLSLGLLRRGTALDVLAVSALISLIALPHLQYDYCLLLPVLAAGLRRSGVSRIAIVAPVLVVWYGWYFGGLVVQPYRIFGVSEVLCLMSLALVGLIWGGATRIDSPSPRSVDALSVG